jgi:hypothetical protein
MDGPTLSRMSKIAPNPDFAIHSTAGMVVYTCHMAALHWAFMALGRDHYIANLLVTAIAQADCRGCQGGGANHSSISADTYGAAFCLNARQIPNRNALSGMVQPGDLLITNHPRQPMHSMIVRQNQGADHVTVKGFNNTGTLGTGMRLKYDPVSHNITKDKYWINAAAGKFGHTGDALWVVQSADFLRAARNAAAARL